MNTFVNIDAEEIIIGEGVEIHPSAIIRGINGAAKRIEIGDFTYIGANVQIILDEFLIGDYSKIQHSTNIHGYKPCRIGHNAWIGQYSIIDSIGGMEIGDNCGIGAHSQLWSHIKYGDTLSGCRFHSQKPMTIGNDVWFVGHCIVSPITAKDKSMAMVGSLITKDMEENHIYAGSPAKDITNKIGGQFEVKSNYEKKMVLNDYLSDFSKKHKSETLNIRIVEDFSLVNFDNNTSYFNVSDMKYTKKYSRQEVAFMKYLLPEKGKFIPYSS